MTVKDMLHELDLLLDDAYKVIAYYCEIDPADSTARTGTSASFSMRELGESVLNRMHGV